MKTICYIKAGVQCFENIDQPTNQDTKTFINQWKHNNPNLQLVAIFDNAQNEVAKSIKNENTFEDNCEKYGFKPEDFGAMCTFSNEDWILTSIMPRKTKYKILWTATTNSLKHIRTTVSYAHDLLKWHRI